MKYLFVCTGNTCRSPMAEKLAEKYYKNHEFGSAGISAFEGSTASSGAINAMKKYDIDLSNHTSAILTPDMILDYDYIIPMTENHKNILLSFGVKSEKILTFKNDIKDPYMSSDEVYLDCAQQIKNSIFELLGDPDVS